MKLIALVFLLSLTAAAQAQGILQRYGAGGSINERFGNDDQQQQTITINGQPYTAPPPATRGAPRVFAPERQQPSGKIDPRTGEFYPEVGPNLYLNPRTGKVFHAPN